MSRTPPLRPPPRIDPKRGPGGASPSLRSRFNRPRRPRPWVVALMALLGVGLVVVIVVLPRLVDGRAEERPADSVAQSMAPAPKATIPSAPPTPPVLTNSGVRRTVDEALEEGRTALVNRDFETAIAAFRRASTLEPGNTAAETGLRRSEVLAEAQRLETTAVAHERLNENEAAEGAARRALELDPKSEIARGVVYRVALAARKETYRDLVTRGLRALEDQQYQLAMDAFSAASKQQPAAPEVADGLKRARAGMRQQTLTTHLARAIEAEEAENWPVAVHEYRSVLELDPVIAIARDGFARSSQRLELTRMMNYHLNNPDRLATIEVLEEAADLTAEARTVTPRGPRFSELIARLDRLVTLLSTPVPVVLESDGLTEVVLFRVGELGTFDLHTVELRPGTYTVVGRRAGFRDVRLRFKVGPGQPPPTVSVRCTEAI